MDYTRDIYGYLEGQVMLGPICPVERFDTPCPVSPEAYAAREILISQGQEILARAKLDAQGRYWIALMPGRYRVDINRVGMDRSSDVPKAIDIARGKTLRLDIEIDTGIR
jgi:hypothetical protein